MASFPTLASTAPETEPASMAAAAAAAAAWLSPLSSSGGRVCEWSMARGAGSGGLALKQVGRPQS
jgi:hypothetical protein